MKHALIIGASRGLGLGLVQEHLGRGWCVTATVRGPSASLEALHRDSPGRLAIETLDTTSTAQAVSLAGRLDGQVFDLLLQDKQGLDAVSRRACLKLMSRYTDMRGLKASCRCCGALQRPQ